MHRRVCREANVMARSSAFGASFCMKSEISMGFNSLRMSCQKTSREIFMRLKQCHRGRKLSWRECKFVKISKSERFENCSFDINDISSSSLQRVRQLELKTSILTVLYP